MSEWGRLGIYIGIALIGSTSHYIKKRYVEGAIDIDFKSYVLTNKKATFNTFTACIAVAYGYTFTEADLFALSTIGGVFTGGYVADSGLNKVEETS